MLRFVPHHIKLQFLCIIEDTCKARIVTFVYFREQWDGSSLALHRKAIKN